MLRKTRFFFVVLIWSVGVVAMAADALTIKMFRVAKQGRGELLGTITAENTAYGLKITPNLHGLKPGLHGFHVHQKPKCGDFGKAAGGHFDPQKTGKHLGPYDSKGHLGDLPALYFNRAGIADHPVLAPRLTVNDLKDHTLIIHAGGDNYRDVPKKLGGGGARVACGVVK